MTPRTRRWQRVILGVLLLGTALWVLGPILARSFIRHRLQSMIADQLDAKLEIGKLTYNMPYGVTVSDAVLVTAGSDGTRLELLRIPRLQLRLARFPLGSGPLVIQSLTLDNPVVHLIRTSAGLSGRRVLAKSDDASVPGPAGASSASAGNSAAPGAAARRGRLSEMFRLTHLAMRGGRIIYENQCRRGAVPMTWKNLDIDLSTSRRNDASYAYRMKVNNTPLATLESSGTADLDDLVLRIQSCALRVNVNYDERESALSAEIQQPLREWGARGALSIDLSGVLPLRDPGSSVYQLVLELRQASARVPVYGTALDRVALKIELTDGSQGVWAGKGAPAPGRRPTARLDRLDIAAGDSSLQIRDALMVADMGRQTWSLGGLQGHLQPGQARVALPAAMRATLANLRLRGGLDFSLQATGPLQPHDLNRYAATLGLSPRDLSLQPEGFDAPIDSITPASITVADGVITLRRLRGSVDGNLMYLKEVHVALADLPGKIHVSDASGCITFGPGQHYPAALAGLLSQCNPVGPFFFEGRMDIDTRKPAEALDYNLQVHTTRGRMAVGERRIPITGINAIAYLTPAMARITHFTGWALDGSVSAIGAIEPRGQKRYHLNAALRNVDLKQLGRYLADPGKPAAPLSGRGVLVMELDGTLPTGNAPAYAGLMGRGEFEILDGDFWRVPLMKSIADSVEVKEAITVGEAAGRFHIANRVIHFDRAIASAPALGVEGAGDVTFDGRLRFQLIADVLGRWSERAGGGVVGGVLDRVQEGVNVATRQALYQVDLTGTVSDPRPNTIVAPYISKQIAKLLGQSVDQSHKGKLLQTLHDEDPAADPPIQSPRPPADSQ
ncbi:MAG TPA: hypothetical protein VFC78_20280 [Tepidisphaeraceae bacterium]|nr:hypothetical protein [Tepidisphaeraceae bacterium]